MLDKIPRYLYVLYLSTVIYQLIAAGTLTFSKQEGVATERGGLLYEDDH